MNDIWYPCDPNKNVACNKKACFINGGPCQETRHFEYADIRSVAFPKELFQKQHEWVQVVRCKDCTRHQYEEPGMVYCPDVFGGWVDNDFFCGAGISKEGEENAKE